MEIGLNIRDHLFTKLPVPASDFSGQTIIVTGASSGLGLETSCHLVRLKAEHVILAVRSLDKGNEARESILNRNRGTQSTVSVWPLDLSSYESVMSFGSRVDKTLSKVDCVVQNASIAVLEYQTMEGNESTLTVNVLSMMLLTLLLIPALRRSRQRDMSEEQATLPLPRITIVSSASHVTAKLPTSNIYATLNDPQRANMLWRYGVSKLMQLFLSESLAERIPSADILVNCVDPGAAKTNILRHVDHGIAKLFSKVEQLVLGRTAEHASRGVVWALERRVETHGQYVAHCRIYRQSRFARSEEGRRAQSILWEETMVKLNEILPGLPDIVGWKER